MHFRVHSQVYSFWIVIFVVLGLAMSFCNEALAQPNQSEPAIAQYEFKPLVDRTRETPQLDDATMKTIYGEPAGSSPFVLTGRVENLENAIRIEKDEVDWYGWYLGARTYLSKWGGLDCDPGTPIKFYRNGVIEVDTNDLACMNSVAGKIYPLPADTQLDAVILPVRQGKLPPASQGELYNHIKASERKK